jgi:hypothetical protein
MKKLMLMLMLCFLFFAGNVFAIVVNVYPQVPGLDPSPHYSFRVHEVGSDEWMTPFAWITRCVDEATADSTHYFSHLADWSNTYANFEMADNAQVEVEITKLDGSTGTPVDIQSAVAHPRRKVRSWRVENGKAYVIIDKPVLFAVDIDGQMDEQDTGKDYSGPPIHTVTVFANPFIQNKPEPDDPDVYAVQPGQTPPETGNWNTLYFMPGIHDIGKSFRVHKDTSYYIPGDAIVHGTFNNDGDGSDGSNIHIFGHGTLSGERIPHPDDDAETLDSYHYKPIEIESAGNTSVEGITIADSANHSLMLIKGYSPATPTDIRWVKIFTWRGNGDGINPFGNVLVEDCFIRTQDDSFYVNGRGIRRCTIWNDTNGSAFVLTAVDRISNPDLVVEDCDIIYARASWNNWSGGRLFNMRATGSGAGGSNVTFRNISVEDARPTLQQFFILMDALEPYISPPLQRGPGDMSGILFQNIKIAGPSVLGEPEILLGNADAQIRDMIFDNVTVGGQHYDSIDDFLHNEYVHDLVFTNTGEETMTYLNTSGYGKWYVYGDWNSGVEPARNDIVNHTAVADVLTVDAPAYAGTLNIAHAGTAVLVVESGGDLVVANGVSVAASGGGELNLLDGILEIQNSSGGALSVVNGNIHIDKGTLLWAGDHISDIQSLYAAGKISMAGGQNTMLSASATLIGQTGSSQLYADYNDATAGYTTVWVTDLSVLTLSKVEAEDYTAMSGIKTQSTSDTGGGLHMSHIENGDWAEYLVDVPAAGTYAVDFRVSSAGVGGTVEMVVGGSIIGSATVPVTGGWSNWATISTTTTFDTAGPQTLRLNFVGGSGYLYNVNWFEFTMSTPLLLSDFNGDGKVNLIDLSVMSADWQNGYDMTDLLQLAEDWLIDQ